MLPYLKQSVLYILFGFCLLGLCIGCSFPGKVYLSIYWEFDLDIPDSYFACSAPRVPTDIADIKAGVYYYTHPGKYLLTYYYSDSPTPRNLEFELKQDVTMLGVENAYYDLIISKSKVPVIYKVPTEP